MPEPTEYTEIIEEAGKLQLSWAELDLNHTTGLVKQIYLANYNIAWIIIEESGSNYTVVFNIWNPNEYIDPYRKVHCISKLSLLRDALIHKYPVKIRHDRWGNTILDLAIAAEDSSLG